MSINKPLFIIYHFEIRKLHFWSCEFIVNITNCKNPNMGSSCSPSSVISDCLYDPKYLIIGKKNIWWSGNYLIGLKLQHLNLKEIIFGNMNVDELGISINVIYLLK